MMTIGSALTENGTRRNDAKEMIKDKNMTINDLSAENKVLREKCDMLLKEHMELANKYLSIVWKIKQV